MPSHTALGWRTPVAMAFIILSVFGSLALDVSALAIGNVGEEDLTGVFIVLAASAGSLVTILAAALFFCIWLHRAATNVRIWGQRNLQFTPGWCVGWWFVPVASLFKPAQAVKEVWRASDPDTVGGEGTEWMSAIPAPTIFGVWWGSWIVAGVLGRISSRIDDAPVAGWTGLAGTVCMALAAASILSIMRKLDARQQACFARLEQLRDAAPAPYGSYGGAYGAPPPAGGYGAPY
jgi:hypothetical protein